MAIRIKITQKKSGIGWPDTQRRTLAGLGLKRPHHSVVLQDTIAIRGMIKKVSHLVEIEPVE